MNNKKYDLKKVSKVAVATLFLLFLLVDFLAWPQIGSSTSGIVTAFVFEVAVLLALALYGVHMVNREKKGLTTAGGSFIQTLAKYEFLMEQLISRDFKIKYKRSVLGVFWSFLNPLLMMTVQYVVFSKLLGVRDAGVQHYAIYLLCGIVIFNGFNDCCNQAMRAIISNASLITKVYVPKYIYPVTKVLSASINMVLSMVPLLLVTILFGRHFCGYACAFGSFGDAVYEGFSLIWMKCFHKKKKKYSALSLNTSSVSSHLVVPTKQLP